MEGYFRPKTVDEALKLLKDHRGDDTHLIAGGQSLMQAVKSRLITPENLIDLQSVSELRGITKNGDRLTVGAMTRYREIAESDALPGALLALQDAAAHVGDRQVRNRGTIGGSLSWNYLSACIPPTCIGLGAQVELRDSEGGGRVVAIEEFLGGPLETQRADNEILVAVHFDVPASEAGSAYRKWGLVTDALPVVNICVSLNVDGSGACTSARIALGSLSSGPRRSADAEAAFVGLRADDADGIKSALSLAAKNAGFESEVSADADYKEVLLNKIGRDAVATAFVRTGGNV